MGILINALAAFGGGVLAAGVGALQAFIMTGLIAIGAAIAHLAGLDLGASIYGTIAFGVFFGPHISFAGGAAAAAYAGKIGKLESGSDIVTPLAKFGDPKILAVGGIFGVIGWAIGTYIVPAIFGGLIPVGTDAPGMTVAISAIIARFVFGKRGLMSAKPSGATSAQSMLIAVSFSLMIAGGGLGLVAAGVDLAAYNILVFGIAAFTLLFAGGPCWHPVGIISAYATMVAVGAGLGDIGVVALAVVCGVLAQLLQDFFGGMINTDVDSHIDPPACSICLMTIVVNIIAMVL